MTPAFLHLSAPGDFVPFPGVLEGRPKEVAGQPCSYYWKDLIGPEDYYNAARNFHLHSSPSRLKTWEKTGNAMVAAGVNIPIVCDHKETAENSVGKIEEFEVRPTKLPDGTTQDRLWGLCQFIGADAPLLAARNLVSVGVPVGDYIDGKGRNWGDAIRHVALTPVPVVPDQQPFIAASDAATSGAILNLAAISQRSDPMKTLKCSEECMSALQDLVPGLQDVPEDEKMTHINSHLQTLHAAAKEDAGYDDDGDADDSQLSNVAKMSAADVLETARKKRDGWRTKLVASRASSITQQTKIQELSAAMEAAKPKVLDGRTTFLLSQAIATKRDAAVASGSVDENTVKRLDALFSKNGKPTILALSQESDESPLLAMEVWDALAANKPDTSKIIKTGIQNLSNALPMGGGAGAPDNSDKQKALDRMQKVANGEQGK